ncbi:MAG: RagB/SusD family nutrient uptake outer membrane protein [Chitinophagaceae bacterium]
MKYINNIVSFSLLTALMLTSSCKKVLVEENRSNITPGILSSPLGLQAGLNACYSNLRYLYGQEPQLYLSEAGVDEAQRGDNAGTQMFFNNIQATDGNVSTLWNTAYQSINTLNGVIGLGPKVDFPIITKTTVISEAKFLRAFYYFMLVQTFGDVSLHLDFNTNPSVADSRQPIADVYAAIIKDLTEAAAGLPVKPTLSKGQASKSAALFLLAKVYLTRGWSTAAQTADFQNAYATATGLINDKATYNLDLWQDFKDVNANGNDYGKEILWVIDRNTNITAAETNFGGGGGGSPYGGNKENRANFYFRPNYPGTLFNVNRGISGATTANFIMMNRDITNGRPYVRIRPSNYTFNIAFAERANDSRYEKTFQTVWIFNRGDAIAATIAAATGRGMLINNVDTAIWMPGQAVSQARIMAFKGAILTPDGYTGSLFPALSKYEDPGKLAINDASERPFVMFRLSELYLVAAEAAFKGGAPVQNAADMINVLRQRAAYRTTNSAAQNAVAASAQTIMVGSITLDFILDEYCRELFGEWRRWYDLVRTKTLATRVATYNADALTGFKTPRDLLRPIPQSQIDLVTEGPAYPQNPGY